MTSYATREDMIAVFGEDALIGLTGTYDAPDVISEPRLASAIDRASLIIDGVISARYPAGLDRMPRLLSTLCCDLARYDLCGTGGRLMTDEVRDRKTDAYKLLGMIADGRVKLGLDAAGETVDWGEGVQRVPGDTTLSDALRDY